MSNTSTDPKGSITLTPTKNIIAGSRHTWTFVYTAGDEGIAVGGSIRIWTPQHHSYRLRYFEWDLQQIECWTDGDARVTAAVRNSGLMRYPAICVFVAGKPLKPGETVTILVGDTLAGGPHAQVQKLAWQSMTFRTEVDTQGSGEYHELAQYPVLDILADRPANLIVIAPITPDVGKSFRLIVRVEDQYTNICHAYAGRIALSCTDRKAELPAEYRFTTADGGIVEISGCVLHSEGIHQITARSDDLQLVAMSNPIYAAASPRFHIYLGDMHAQSGYHIRDLAFGTNADLFRYAQHVQGLDFCAATDLVARFQESPEQAAWWPQKLAETEAANEPGKFVTIQAYEWNSRDAGHRNVFFPGSDVPMYRYRHGKEKPVDDIWGMPDPAWNTPDDLQAFLKGSGAITIPHHTNSDNDYSAEDLPRERRKHNWHPHDWHYGPYANEPLIEIHQGRGSFETDELSQWVLLGGFGSSVQDGLRLGRRLGFVGGSDSHIGRTSPAISFFTMGKRGGLTCVYAEELTREHIFEALRARRIYATDGVRMFVRFEVNDTLMGGEIHLTGAATPRVVRCEAIGTRAIARIEIIRDNQVVYTHPGCNQHEKFTWTDQSTCVDGMYYYARIIQEEDGIGWASPVWINLT